MSGTSEKTVIYEVVLNTLPSVVLMALTLLLVVHVKLADRRRKKLLGHQHINNRRTREIRGTTLMLAALILSTIVLEAMPSVLLIIANFRLAANKTESQGTEGEMRVELKFITSPKLKAFVEYFSPLLVLMPVLSSIVNFIIYCVMSRQFRSTFMDITSSLCRPCCPERVRKSSVDTRRSTFVTSTRAIERGVIQHL